MDNTAQIYQIVSIVAFVLSAVGFAFALFCFFKFRIVKIVNDLSGRTAKKTIAKIRNENEKSGDKPFRPSPKMKERGTKTEKIRESEKLMNKKPVQMNSTDNSELSFESKATELLSDMNKTELLSEGTELLRNNSEVSVHEEGTVLLVNKNAQTPIIHSKLEIIQSIVLIHTNEVI